MSSTSQPTLAGSAAAAAEEGRAVVSLPRALGLTLEAVPAESWAARLEFERRANGAVFVDLFAGPVVEGRIGLTLLISRGEGQGWLALRDALPPRGSYPSLVGGEPAAAAYESEVYRTAGLLARGHPDLADEPSPATQRPDGLAGTVVTADPAAEQPLELIPDSTAGVVDYPLGPVRSGIVESGHYSIGTVGEEIVDLRLRLGYKHRGVETLALEVAPTLLPLLAERLSGTDAVANGFGLAQALERLTDLRPSPRAELWRGVAAELERIHVHVGFMADLCQATGLAVAQAQYEAVRERLLRLAGRLTGHRYLFGFVVPGGVAFEPGREALSDLTATLTAARRDLLELGRMATATSSHMDRLLGTGIVPLEAAETLSLTGPLARAAGFEVDARRDHPYPPYVERAFPVAQREAGDAAARLAVRNEEALVSADLILDWAEQLAGGEPEDVGPAEALPDLAASSAALGWAEGARGTEVHWLETDAGGRLVRYRYRSASFACWQAFAPCVPGGNILTDFPIVEQSFGLSYAGHDR